MEAEKQILMEQRAAREAVAARPDDRGVLIWLADWVMEETLIRLDNGWRDELD